MILIAQTNDHTQGPHMAPISRFPVALVSSLCFQPSPVPFVGEFCCKGFWGTTRSWQYPRGAASHHVWHQAISWDGKYFTNTVEVIIYLWAILPKCCLQVECFTGRHFPLNKSTIAHLPSRREFCKNLSCCTPSNHLPVGISCRFRIPDARAAEPQLSTMFSGTCLASKTRFLVFNRARFLNWNTVDPWWTTH